MGAFTDSIINDLKQEFHQTMETVGGEMVADIRKEISIRVQYRKSKVIRSVSPDPPRYEDGGLWGSVAMENTVSEKTAMLLVYCPGKLPFWLEYGTIHMGPRRFFGPAYDRWVPRVLNAVGGSESQ